MKKNLFSILVYVIVLYLWLSSIGFAADYIGPIINTHSQYDHKIEIEEVISIVKDAGIYKVILSVRGNRTNEDVLMAAKTYPNIIVPSARTKFRFYLNGHQRWYDYIDDISRNDQFVGLQELILYHAAKVSRRGQKVAPEQIVNSQDKQVEYAVAMAKIKGWPVTLHYEFRSLQEDQRRQYFADMTKLLANHPDQSFALMHMGQLDATDVEQLINAHANIYFHLSMTANLYRLSTIPWTFIFVEDGEIGQLQPQWKTILERYPKRFLLAFDGVFARVWRRRYVRDVQEWRAALGTLNKNTADLIARGNAERLWPAIRK